MDEYVKEPPYTPKPPKRSTRVLDKILMSIYPTDVDKRQKLKFKVNGVCGTARNYMSKKPTRTEVSDMLYVRFGRPGYECFFNHHDFYHYVQIRSTELSNDTD